jgi:transposase-like protein
MGDGWYYCRRCRKKFTVRGGTLFEGSKIPLHKWLSAIWLLAYREERFNEKMDASNLSRWLAITYRSARFLIERLEQTIDA